jgi:hypothetical protein
MEYSAKVQMPKSVFNERLPIITKRLLDEAAKLQFGFASGSGTSLRYLQFQLESGAINLYGRVNSNTYHSVSISSHEQGSDQVIVIDGYIGDDGLQAAWCFLRKFQGCPYAGWFTIWRRPSKTLRAMRRSRSQGKSLTELFPACDKAFWQKPRPQDKLSPERSSRSGISP